MNAVQFGRWFSERRRTSGWSSQRLLAQAAQQHPQLCQSGISEDFLARLEAGHLAHPLRGTVRRRILLLAWLLCKTPRDLKTYIKAVGLSNYSDDEQTRFHLLSEQLTALQTPPPLLLPTRPTHLQGREAELESIMRALSSPETRICGLTGMPGVGKSALAYEVLHRLATAESEHSRRFPDGIATFTCTGRQGTRGLISLLTEITSLFTTGTHNASSRTLKRQASKPTRNNQSELPSEPNEVEPELAAIIGRARAALANKRVLLLLDDLDPAFPLRQAVDVLLAQGIQALHEANAAYGHEQRVILITSQFAPSSALISTRLHVQPLNEEAALALLRELLGEEPSELNLIYARQACAAVGYLPLAIEGIATAVQANGIPLTLVATHLMAHPLGGLLDSQGEIRAKMERALAHLEPEMRADYLLLAALGLSDFDLETATAALALRRLPLPAQATTLQASQPQFEPVNGSCGANRTAPLTILTTQTVIEQEREQLARLASTAAMLGQFVRSSLLESAPGVPDNDIRYRMHTLLYHYAREMAHTLPLTEYLELAQHNMRHDSSLIFTDPCKQLFSV